MVLLALTVCIAAVELAQEKPLAGVIDKQRSFCGSRVSQQLSSAVPDKSAVQPSRNC